MELLAAYWVLRSLGPQLYHLLQRIDRLVGRWRILHRLGNGWPVGGRRYQRGPVDLHASLYWA